MKNNKKQKELQDAFNFFDSPKGHLESFGKSEEEVKKQIEEDAKKKALQRIQKGKY